MTKDAAQRSIRTFYETISFSILSDRLRRIFMRDSKALLCTFLLGLLVLAPALGAAQSQKTLFLSSTIGPTDAGIVGVLEEQFEKESGINVRHVGAGTGAALEMAPKSSVDLVMVHAKSLEEKFVQEGYGTERIPPHVQ
jgi:tungstate transport system substrate-binding protein